MAVEACDLTEVFLGPLDLVGDGVAEDKLSSCPGYSFEGAALRCLFELEFESLAGVSCDECMDG